MAASLGTAVRLDPDPVPDIIEGPRFGSFTVAPQMERR
jgi:hypothetical protein